MGGFKPQGDACAHCGSPLTGSYEYLPGKLFIAIGILDQADQLAPQLHAHAACRLPWLHIQDSCEQVGGSARGEINGVTNG